MNGKTTSLSDSTCKINELENKEIKLFKNVYPFLIKVTISIAKRTCKHAR